MNISTRSWGPLLAVALVLTGCTGAGGRTAPSFPPPTTQTVDPSSAVVLQIRELGGYVASWSLLTRLPPASVYGDGRVIHEVDAFTTPVDQLPAMPQVVQQSVSPAGLDALAQRAAAAGVGDGADLGQPSISDTPTTRFVLATDDGSVWSDAYALRASAGLDGVVGEPVPSPSIPTDIGLTGEQAEARYELLDLAAALEDLPGALGAEQVGPPAPYRPQALAVVVAPGSADPDLEAVAWPGPALPGQDVKTHDTTCTVVRGADLAPVLEAVGQVRLRTPWTDGGRTWDLRFRPLLPDENTCQDLAASSPEP